jgi:hypothetical protein
VAGGGRRRAALPDIVRLVLSAKSGGEREQLGGDALQGPLRQELPLSTWREDAASLGGCGSRVPLQGSARRVCRARASRIVVVREFVYCELPLAPISGPAWDAKLG